MLTVELTSYYIGQGTSNLIKVVNGTKTDLILIDLGADSGLSPATSCPELKQDSDKFVIKAITNEINAITTQPKLRRLIISHLDCDHINLIKYMLTGTGAKIEKVYIGGSNIYIANFKDCYDETRTYYDKKENKNFPKANTEVRPMAAALLDAVAAETDCVLLDGYDTYNKAGDLSLYEAKDGNNVFRLMVLCSRFLHKGSKPSSFINSNSAVVVAEYLTSGVLKSAVFYAGDATSKTMKEINNRIRIYSGKYKFSTILPSQKVLIVPHHGAGLTSCNGESYGKTAGPVGADRFTEAAAFTENIQPGCIYASAHHSYTSGGAEKSPFHHPSNMALGIFGKYTEALTARHPIAVYDITLKQEPNKSGSGFKYPASFTAVKDFDCMRKIYTSQAYVNNPMGKDLSVFGNLVCKMGDGGVLGIEVVPVM